MCPDDFGRGRVRLVLSSVGYCIDAIDPDFEKIRRYGKYREASQRQQERMRFDY